MNDNIPTAPQNFDHIPRYQSSLPLERVKELREKAVNELHDVECMRTLMQNTRETDIIETLAGYILQLTELNNEQK